jgi:hypothetical protein
MDAALREVGEEGISNQEDPLQRWGVVLVVGQAPSAQRTNVADCLSSKDISWDQCSVLPIWRSTHVCSHKRTAFLVCAVTLHASSMMSRLHCSLLGSLIARAACVGEFREAAQPLRCCCSTFRLNCLTAHNRRHRVIQSYKVPDLLVPNTN